MKHYKQSQRLHAMTDVHWKNKQRRLNSKANVFTICGSSVSFAQKDRCTIIRHIQRCTQWKQNCLRIIRCGKSSRDGGLHSEELLWKIAGVNIWVQVGRGCIAIRWWEVNHRTSLHCLNRSTFIYNRHWWFVFIVARLIRFKFA